MVVPFLAASITSFLTLASAKQPFGKQISNAPSVTGPLSTEKRKPGRSIRPTGIRKRTILDVFALHVIDGQRQHRGLVLLGAEIAGGVADFLVGGGVVAANLGPVRLGGMRSIFSGPCGAPPGCPTGGLTRSRRGGSAWRPAAARKPARSRGGVRPRPERRQSGTKTSTFEILSAGRRERPARDLRETSVRPLRSQARRSSPQNKAID